MRKHVKEERSKPKLVDPNSPPEVAEVVTNDGRRDGRVNRFENKFKRDIMAMMEGHTNLNLQIYAITLEQR